MFKTSIKSDSPLLGKKLQESREQIPFIERTTINSGAFACRDDVKKGIGQVFIRPTSFILNSSFVDKATKSNPFAVVYIKQDPPRGGKKSPAEVLEPHVVGGKRFVKPFEWGLRSNIWDRLRGRSIPPDTHFVPGEDAQLNQYGNMGKARIKTILKQVQSPASKYFLYTPEGEKYPLVMHKSSKKADPEVILAGIKTPNYKQRFDFETIVSKSFEKNYESLLISTMDKYLPKSDF